MKRTKFNNCLKCDKKLTGEYQLKFCSNSCASSFNRKGKKHSEKTKQKISKSRKGKYKGCNHPRWKGGRVINDGYKYVLNPNHPYSTKSGYVLEHRLIMEKELNRYLKPGEVVHHINEDRLDNRIENLKLMTHGEHSSLHHKGIKNNKKGHPGNQFAAGNKMPKQSKQKISRAIKKRWKEGLYDQTNFHP